MHMTYFLFSLLSDSSDDKKAFRGKLKSLYKDHKVVSYHEARVRMYNIDDCFNNKIPLIYGSINYSWVCNGSEIPSAINVNAEHLVPQSFFDSKEPMVSDLFSLFPSPTRLNLKRSNYPFGEVNIEDCTYFCKDNDCQRNRPDSIEHYSCLDTDKKVWMPAQKDKGLIARSIFYFFTMYDDIDVDLSKVGDINTFKEWSATYQPDFYEITRNNRLNLTQGNRNPYIDNPTYVNYAW